MDYECYALQEVVQVLFRMQKSIHITIRIYVLSLERLIRLLFNRIRSDLISFDKWTHIMQ